MTETLLIFDCDGVLVDSEVLAAKAVSRVLNGYGLEISVRQALDRYVGISTASMTEMIEAEYACRLPSDFAVRIHENVNEVLEAELVEMTGANAVLSELSGLRCIASSSSLRGIRRSLRVTGLDGHFREEAIFSAEMVENGKPSPDLFLHAAREMDFSVENCVVIEDSLPGVKGAVAAGMRVIGFAGGSHIRDGHHQRLRTAGAGLVFDDMHLLPDILANFEVCR
ncbi:MAG: HAD-IA family hydrolase [Hyphomicrobiaceae bacterium]|nr:HAD-IA family hydrolase [Hyphomicrobiaceae bacterium]